MDTLLSLRVFTTVAELRSFTDTAERFGLSAAMTSKHVQHIEARVGARLLNRTSRSVSLTEAGTLYLAAVRPLLEGLDEAEARLSQATHSPRGTLRISLPVWMASPGFAKLFAAYRRAFPQVILDLDLSGKPVSLVDDGFDLALRVTTTPDEGLIARRIGEISFQLVASPSLLESLGNPMTIDQLTGAPFLAYTPVAAQGRIPLGQGRELHLKPVMQSANETLLHLAACEGAGIAIMPDILVRDDLRAGRLQRLLEEIAPQTIPLYALYADRSYLPAKVRSLLDFLAGPHGIATIRG